MSTQKLTSRIEARTTSEVKSMIEAAAAAEGRNVSDFIIACAVENARRVLESQSILRLNREDSLAFAEALLNPPKPNEALLKAAHTHKNYERHLWNRNLRDSTSPSTKENTSPVE